MPVYEYKALNGKGRKVAGIVAAEGPAGARLKLSRGSVFPTELRAVPGEKNMGTIGSLARYFALSGRINPVEITAALRQLAALVSSGIPILECLSGLIEQTKGKHLKKVFTQVQERVAEGASLSSALFDHPRVFSPMHVSMIQAGECGSALGIILRRLADFSEKARKRRKKLESALAYPLFLFLVSTVIVIFLLSFVMPGVISIFERIQQTLPWPTRGLILVTQFMEASWWLIFPGIGGILGGMFAWRRTGSGRRLWDRTALHLPLFGRHHRNAVIARFTRTLSILLKSGIPLVDSLKIAGASMGNRVLEDAVIEVIRAVEAGQGFSMPLGQSGQFPSLVVQLSRAGEQSGALEEMLAKAAEVYEEDVELGTATLTSLVEPFIILGMGVAVGFMVIAILLPLFDMTRVVP